MRVNSIFPKYIRPNIKAMSYPALVYQDKVVFDDKRIPDLMYNGVIKRTEIIKHIILSIELWKEKKKITTTSCFILLFISIT